MKIFLSYGHDSNALLFAKIRDYLSKDAILGIYHMSIEQPAELPSDMKENYHFEGI